MPLAADPLKSPAVALMTRTVEHLPGKHPQQAHAGDGVPGVLDKLKLGGRVDLMPGENLLSSQKIPSVRGGDWSMPAAVVDGPQGRELRLGFVHFEDVGKWRASDRGGTVKLSTAEMARMRNELARLHDLGEQRRAQLRAAGDDNDDTVADGTLATGPWGDLHFTMTGDADGDAGWHLDLRRRPTDASADWWPDYGYEGDTYVTFKPAHVRSLVKLLDRFAGLETQPAAEAVAVLSSSPALRLMLFARACEAEELIKRGGKLVRINRGAKGRFGSGVDVPVPTGDGDDDDGDGLDKMTNPQLKALAKAEGIKGYSKLRKAELIQALRYVRASDPGGSKPAPKAVARAGQTENRIRQAYDELSRRPGEWIALADLRGKLSDLDRSEVDEALKRLAVAPGVQVIPWDNRNALQKRDHDAALGFGGEQNHAIRFDPPANDPLSRQMRADHEAIMSWRAEDRARTELAAKRARLAALEAQADPNLQSDLRKSSRARVAADDLRREIARDEADAQRRSRGEALPVSKPDPQVRQQISSAYAQLAPRPGDLVSLVKLRAALADVPRADQDRLLRQMDRERLIQLEPDIHRRGLPPEAHEAAIVLGGEPKHFITVPR